MPTMGAFKSFTAPTRLVSHVLAGSDVTPVADRLSRPASSRVTFISVRMLPMVTKSTSRWEVSSMIAQMKPLVACRVQSGM